MSLSPFDSFQSRFVTYLLNFPRISKNLGIIFLILWKWHSIECTFICLLLFSSGFCCNGNEDLSCY